MRLNKIITSALLGITLANAKLVMIIRHGEKLNDNVTNLSDKGKARAECLTEIFGSNGIYTSPQKIFAQCPTENKQSTRPRDTVVPLAKNLGIQVDLTYTSGKFKKLVKDIESSSEDVFLISWSNDKIDNIAKEFDIKKAPKWDSEVFDDIWVITDGTIPFSKSNVSPIAAYQGKKEMDMYVVKENVDQCINRILNKTTQTQNTQNTQNTQYDSNQYSSTQQQNNQYGNSEQQFNNTQQQSNRNGNVELVENGIEQNFDNLQNVKEDVIIDTSGALSLKSTFITITGIICFAFILL